MVFCSVSNGDKIQADLACFPHVSMGFIQVLILPQSKNKNV